MLPPSVLGDNCPWTPWPLASEVSGASFHSPRQSGFIPSAPGWAVREAVRVGFAGTWLQIGGGESRGPRWARGWCWWGSQGHSIRGVMRPRSQVQASGHCIRAHVETFQCGVEVQGLGGFQAVRAEGHDGPACWQALPLKGPALCFGELRAFPKAPLQLQDPNKPETFKSLSAGVVFVLEPVSKMLNLPTTEERSSHWFRRAEVPRNFRVQDSRTPRTFLPTAFSSATLLPSSSPFFSEPLPFFTRPFPPTPTSSLPHFLPHTSSFL